MFGYRYKFLKEMPMISIESMYNAFFIIELLAECIVEQNIFS